MEKLIVILSVIIFLIAIGLFAVKKFMEYRDSEFNKLTIHQVKERLRSSRKLLYHICLDENKINSTHAKLLRKSIAFLENRIQQLGGYYAKTS